VRANLVEKSFVCHRAIRTPRLRRPYGARVIETECAFSHFMPSRCDLGFERRYRFSTSRRDRRRRLIDLTETAEEQMPTTLALTLPTKSVAAGQLEFAAVCLFSLLGLTGTAAVLACVSGETLGLITTSMSFG
jgi:hypothetical protein